MSEPKARPIIMSGWSVQRILADEKTMTRRPIKPQAHSYNTDILDPWVLYPREDENDTFGDPSKPIRCPYGKPGDLLWVRETWSCLQRGSGSPVRGQPDDPYIVYRADGEPELPHEPLWEPFRWRASIHMPRKLSRITLRIKDIRVERVQDISIEDCRAEGCKRFEDRLGKFNEKVAFYELWDSIYAKTFPWESNCFVWVIDFMRETCIATK